MKGVDAFPRTDEGNSKRFAERYEGAALFCDDWGKWLLWDGVRWGEDHELEIDRLAASVVNGMLKSAFDVDDTKEQEAWVRWALQSQSATRQGAMLKLARSKLSIRPEQLDADHWLLNCENGTLDLRTGELKDHDPAHLITRVARVEWNVDALCPLFDKYLAQVMPDEDDRKFLQRAIGYSLTGELREHCLFVLWGVGRNGKSTFLELFLKLLGEYSHTTTGELFLKQNNGGNSSELKAELKGTRFTVADELGSSRKLDSTVITSITGGDTISARHLYQRRFRFKPTHKLWVGTNHKPIIDESGPAIWSRIRLVPFKVRFKTEDEQDMDLPAKLWRQRSGILRWAMEGCLAWQKEGLGASQNVRTATKEYRSDQDMFGQFLETRCQLGARLSSTTNELFYEYLDWAAKEGIGKELTLTAFGRTLTERGFEKKRGGGGGDTFRLGLSLRKKLKLVGE